MKILKLISIVLLLISTVSCAQNKKMKTKVDKIKELGRDTSSKITYQILSEMNRDALVNLAKTKINGYLKLVKEKPFNYTDMDVKVLKNSTTFIVYIEQGFKYVPLHSAHYYGFEVFLLAKNEYVGKLQRVNGVDPVIEVKEGFDYYIPSSQELEKIAFVKKAISYKSGENVVVYEKEKHYELVYGTSGEKVDKKTGKVFGSWDRIYPPSEDPLVEMFVNPCQTQKKLKKGFEHLKKLILKNGIKILVDGDNHPNYTYKNFTFRNSSDKNSPMEVIYVKDLAKDALYQIIKSNASYQIDIQDYQQTIALQKRKVAFEHFCTNLLNFKERN